MNTVGVIGLGIMGGGMAQALRAAGHAVLGYDVSADAVRRLEAAGGQAATSAADVARGARVVLSSLPSVAAFKSTVTEIAAARGVRGLIVIDTSTLPLAAKLEARAHCESTGVVLLDCPISGTAARLAERTWDIYCSGPPDAVDQIRPLLKVFSDRLTFFGEFGNATKVKLAANHLVAIYNVACAESLAFLRSMGLDTDVVGAMFSASPVLATGVMRGRLPMMIKRSYTPATMKVDVWQKDMQLIREMADQVGCPTPLFDVCGPLYDAAIAQGLGEADTASVSEVLDKLRGIC